MSRQQPISRQEQIQQDQEGKPVSSGGTDPGSMGGCKKESFVVSAKISSLDQQAGRGESQRRYRTQPAGDDSCDFKNQASVSGTRTRTATRKGEGETGSPPCETVAGTGRRREAGRRHDGTDTTTSLLLATG